MRYSIDDAQNRESILAKMFMQNHAQELTSRLNISRAWWAILQYDKSRYQRHGDVDILFGCMLVDSMGDIIWPPPCDYLIACEVKCSYYSDDKNELKATKKSPQKNRDIRLQLDDHKLDGYNQIILIDMITHAPETSSNPWIDAVFKSDKSRNLAQEFLDSRNLANSDYGHFLFLHTPIYGRQEGTAGSTTCEWKKMPREICESGVNDNVKRSLIELFAKTTVPLYYQSVFEFSENDDLCLLPGNLLFSPTAFKSQMKLDDNPATK